MMLRIEGFTFYWGAVGVSIRLKTPWQATPVSIAWLFPPRKAGLPGPDRLHTWIRSVHRQRRS